MSKIRTVFAFLAMLAVFTTGAPIVLAGPAADYTQQALTKGQWEEAEQELSRRIAAYAADDEARFGLAMVRFARAIEKFGRHHYKYGLQVDQPNVPLLRLPVPENSAPEQLTYEKQRAALQVLLDDLSQVEKTLDGMQGQDVKIVVDLENVRLDFAPGVTGANPKTLMNVIRSVNPQLRSAPTPEGAKFEVAFDKADAFWLQGYCNLLSAGLEFLLAHDWHEGFDAAAPVFYPNLASRPEHPRSLPVETLSKDYNDAADAIALVHLIRWPVVEPQRLIQVRQHLKQVIALSRKNWQAILAETDDDREWLPAPKQKNVALPAMEVSQQRVDVWMNALEAFDAVLDGRKLIPHWRLSKGINMKKVLEEPRPFDLVLWATGHAAMPYLEDGPMLTSEEVNVWQQVFSGNFLLFALYFN